MPFTPLNSVDLLITVGQGALKFIKDDGVFGKMWQIIYD